MQDRTLSMMEVHPDIIKFNRFRNSLRQAGKIIAESMERLYAHEQAAIKRFEETFRAGTTVNIRMPQRYIAGKESQ